MQQQSKIRSESRRTLSNYVAVMGILNAMLKRVSHSLPQIREAIGMLPSDAALVRVSGAGEYPVQR
jgi:hypothetical protein